MKSQKGITLIMVIITIILLTIISGLAITGGMKTFENSTVVKFETYMKILQKKVDIILEEGENYMNLGTALTNQQKQKLQTIITNNDAFIETNDVNDNKLRYFSSSDIKMIFGIEDVQDEIIINFANREVISLNGIKKNGVIHYVESSLY